MWQSISETVRELSSNPWITLSGWVFGIVSLFTPLVWRGQRNQLPTFAVDERVIFDSVTKVHPDLSIRFKNKPVQNLCLTTVYIWNEGGESIRQEDVAISDPLRILMPQDVELLHVEITNITTIAGGFRLDPVRTDGSIPISFDHVDKRQGCEVSVLHTQSYLATLGVAGTFVGVGLIKPSSSLVPSAHRRFLTITSAIAGMVLLAVLVGKPASEWVILLIFPIFVALLTRDEINRRREYRYQRIFPRKGPYSELGEWSRIRERIGLGD
jgi:hypothetical protein